MVKIISLVTALLLAFSTAFAGLALAQTVEQPRGAGTVFAKVDRAAPAFGEIRFLVGEATETEAVPEVREFPPVESID